MPSPGLPPTALLILLLLPALQPSQGLNLTRPLVVCSFQDSIFIRRCVDGEEPTFTGYDTELWRLATARIGLVELQHYTFRCVSLLTDVIAGLQSGTCDVGLGSIIISQDRVNEGILFSRAIYATSLGVLVPAEVTGNDGFFMIKPFDGWVWLAFGLSILLVPVLVLTLDGILAKDGFSIKPKPKKNKKKKDDDDDEEEEEGEKPVSTVVKDSLWAATKLGIQTRLDEPQDYSATRMLGISLFLLFMLLMRCWSAGLTAALTVRQLQSSIKAFPDLRGRSVLTTNLYQDRLERDSIRPIVVPYTAFQSAALPDGWLGLMSSNGVSAVVLEREVLQYVDYTSTCKLRLLPDNTLEQVYWGIAFRNTSVDDAFMQQIDMSILALQDLGTTAILQDKFITNSAPKPSCSFEFQQQYQGVSMLTMGELWGIWVISGAGVLLAFALAAPVWWRRRRARKQEAKQLDRSPSKNPGADLDGLESGKLGSGASSKLGSSAGYEESPEERVHAARLMQEVQGRLDALERQQRAAEKGLQDKLDAIVLADQRLQDKLDAVLRAMKPGSRRSWEAFNGGGDHHAA